MIEFFRSHLLLLVGIPVTYIDLTCFIHSSFTHQWRSSDLNEYIRYKSTIVWSYYLQYLGTLPYLHTLPYLPRSYIHMYITQHT